MIPVIENHLDFSGFSPYALRTHRKETNRWWMGRRIVRAVQIIRFYTLPGSWASTIAIDLIESCETCKNTEKKKTNMLMSDRVFPVAGQNQFKNNYYYYLKIASIVLGKEINKIISTEKCMVFFLAAFVSFLPVHCVWHSAIAVSRRKNPDCWRRQWDRKLKWYRRAWSGYSA